MYRARLNRYLQVGSISAHGHDCKILATWDTHSLASNSCHPANTRTRGRRKLGRWGQCHCVTPSASRASPPPPPTFPGTRICARIRLSALPSFFFKQSKARKMVAQFLSKESPGRISSSPSSIISSALLIRAQGQLTSCWNWKPQVQLL